MADDLGLNDIVWKTLPNSYVAAKQSYLTRNEANQVNELAWFANKHRQLVNMDPDSAQKTFAALEAEHRQFLTELFNVDYGAQVEDKRSWQPYEIFTNPIGTLFTGAQKYSNLLSVGFRYADSKVRNTGATWDEVYNGEAYFNEEIAREVDDFYGPEVSKIARLAATLKSPGEILLELNTDAEFKAFERFMSNDEVFNDAINEYNDSKISPGRAAARGLMALLGGRPEAGQHGVKRFLYDRVSGTVDLAYQVAFDPLTWLTGGVGTGIKFAGIGITKGTRNLRQLLEPGDGIQSLPTKTIVDTDGVTKEIILQTNSARVDKLFAKQNVQEIWNRVGSLVKRWDSGDAKAFEEFYELYGDIARPMAQMLRQNKVYDAASAQEFFSNADNVGVLLSGKQRVAVNAMPIWNTRRKVGVAFRRKMIDTIHGKAPSSARFKKEGGDEIFVFGSNLLGVHGKGAARTAVKEYNATYGQGTGLQGNSYAIPTKRTPYETLPVETIKTYVDEFITFAKENPDKQFNLTAIGTGYAGLKVDEIAPMFVNAPANVRLPLPFAKFLNRTDEVISEEDALNIIRRLGESALTPDDIMNGADINFVLKLREQNKITGKFSRLIERMPLAPVVYTSDENVMKSADTYYELARIVYPKFWARSLQGEFVRATPEERLGILKGTYIQIAQAMGITNDIKGAAWLTGVLRKYDGVYAVETPFSPELISKMRTGGVTNIPIAAGTRITLQSGGAIGADSAWAKSGERYGFETIAHSFPDHKSRSGTKVDYDDVQLQANDPFIKEISQKINRPFPPRTKFAADLIRRNYYQVSNGEAVVAIGYLTSTGVKGGTGWAVEYGKKLGKPVYVFDQKSGRWFVPKGENWELIDFDDIPVYTNFAAVGSAKEFTEAGELAIDSYIDKIAQEFMLSPGVAAQKTQQVVNLRNLKVAGQQFTKADLDENSVYIGRPIDNANYKLEGSPYQNPFKIKDGVSREKVIEDYRKYAEEQLAKNPNWLEPLVGKNLVDWCAPEACHGDVLKELIEKRYGQLDAAKAAPIESFQGDFRFLSNFFPAPVTIDGITYKNAEAAFQASKTTDVEVKKQFSNLDGAAAKSLGKKIQLRSDWENVKVAEMQRIVIAKFEQNAGLKQRLADTGNAELIEGNTWGDTFWGVSKGQGENQLGKILMSLRQTVETPTPSTATPPTTLSALIDDVVGNIANEVETTSGTYLAGQTIKGQMAVTRDQVSDMQGVPELGEWMRKAKEINGELWRPLIGRNMDELNTNWSFLTLAPRLGIRSAIDELLFYGLDASIAEILMMPVARATSRALRKASAETQNLTITRKIGYLLTAKRKGYTEEKIAAILTKATREKNPKIFTNWVAQQTIKEIPFYRLLRAFGVAPKQAELEGWIADLINSGAMADMGQYIQTGMTAGYTVKTGTDLGSNTSLKSLDSASAVTARLNFNYEAEVAEKTGLVSVTDEKPTRIQFGMVGDNEFLASWYGSIIRKLQFDPIAARIIFKNIDDPKTAVRQLYTYYLAPQSEGIRKQFRMMTGFKGTNEDLVRKAFEEWSVFRSFFVDSNGKVIEELVDAVFRIPKKSKSTGVDAKRVVSINSQEFMFDDLRRVFDSTGRRAPVAVHGYNQIDVASKDTIGGFLLHLREAGFSYMDKQLAIMAREPMYISRYLANRKELVNAEYAAVRALTEAGHEITVASAIAKAKFVHIAAENARERTLQYIDNPLVRSHFAFHMRNFARFYRATEDFYRRSGRLAKNNPQALIRLRLSLVGLDASGFIHEDENGEQYFLYAGDEIIFNAVNVATQGFGGQPSLDVLPVRFGSKINMIAPSLDPDSALPSFSGPFSAIPIFAIRKILGSSFADPISGEFKAKFDRYSLGAYSEYSDWVEAIVPTTVKRVWSTMNRNEQNKQVASAMMAAAVYEAAAGRGYNTADTWSEMQEKKTMLLTTAANIMTIRNMLGMFAPAGIQSFEVKDIPKYILETDSTRMSSEFYKVVEGKIAEGSLDPWGEGIALWTKTNPGRLAYTIPRTENQGLIKVEKTREAANWVRENKGFISKYSQTGALFAPQIGEFDINAYNFLKLQGFTGTRAIDDFLLNLYTESILKTDKENKKYWANQIAGTSDPQIKTYYRQQSEQESKLIKDNNPLLAQRLASARFSTYEQQNAMEELRQMITVGDAPDAGRAAILQQMINVVDSAMYAIDPINGGDLLSPDQVASVRRDALIQLERIAGGDPNLMIAINSVFEPILEKARNVINR